MVITLSSELLTTEDSGITKTLKIEVNEDDLELEGKTGNGSESKNEEIDTKNDIELAQLPLKVQKSKENSANDPNFPFLYQKIAMKIYRAL